MNKLKFSIFVLAITLSGLFLFAGSALQTDAPGVQLRAAIEKEEVEGDLQAAIDQYKKIVAENGNDRAVAARALLRLAGCYEKLGREEAQKTYRQLIHDFPDQIDAVQVAKEKLTLLERVNSNMSLRLVWEGPEVELMGETSPDGRYICYTDWDTGDIAIHDLTTGENRRLSGQTEWDGSFAETSRWSPDGKFIAYTWDTPGGIYGVQVVGLDGVKPKRIFPDGCVEDWSPDGRQLLVRNGWEDGLVSLVSVADGSVRHLMKMGRADEEHDHMQFSPDGRYIAYDHQKDIYLLSVDRKIQIPLVKNPANDRLLGWTPDGRNILFTSDRTGAVDAWFLPVKDGNPAGEAKIVRKNIGAVSPLGFTRDGSFFYGGGKDLWNIYIATLDSKPDSTTAAYKKLGLPFEGRNGPAEFSPDGKRMAIVRTSNRSGAGPSAIAKSVLCIHDLETGEEKIFPLNLSTYSLRWVPDGSSILIGGFHDNKSFVGIIDIRTGETTALFPTDKDILGEFYYSPDLSPDGQQVYCFRILQLKEKDPEYAIIAKNLRTGQTRVICKEGKSLPGISVSPDGEWLAAYEHPITEARQGGATERILKIISTKNGTVRELSRFVNSTNHNLFPRWSIDGRYIFFPGIRPGEETWDVWYVPVEGGEPKGLGLSLKRIEHISFHPDGKQFAFSSFGETVHGPEVWVMENFLPEQ